MKNDTKFVAWAGLIVAIIALIVSWVAYNRTGSALQQDIADQVKNQSTNIQTTTQQSIAIAVAEGRLIALKAQFAADQNYDQAQASLDQTRKDLKDSFANATGAAQQRWQQLDNQLGAVGTKIQTRSTDLAAAIQNAIDAFRATMNQRQ